MNGMQKMSQKEMEMVTGGKCNSDYGYFSVAQLMQMTW